MRTVVKLLRTGRIWPGCVHVEHHGVPLPGTRRTHMLTCRCTQQQFLVRREPRGQHTHEARATNTSRAP